MMSLRPIRLADCFILVVVALLGSTCVLIGLRELRSCRSTLPVCPHTVDTQGMEKVTSMTPVYVVEEHHEVLLYWYDAAQKGHIKPQGNVLLHIDGHSDAAPPSKRDVLPLSRQPTLRDIYNMMQKNDVFIQAAGISGLIKRYIWVRPPFDVAEPVVVDHHVINIEFGTISRTNPTGSTVEDICSCVKTYPEGLLTSPGWTCAMASFPNGTSLEEPIPVDRHRCNIKVKDGLVEIVSESKAIELMRSGQWITSLDSVILDIDQDYYGCEAAVQPLYDVNVTESIIQRIQTYVSHIFCPSQPREELVADKFFARLINAVINLKRFCGQMVDAVQMCKDYNTMKTYLSRATRDIFTDIVTRNLRSSLCHSDKTSKIIITSLLRHFLSLTTEQLGVIREIGICFNGSPRTLTYDPSVGMRLCDGYNRPNDSIVPFHTPTIDEVISRTSQLKVMLSSKGLHPGIVTVCRSVRDGYTPRKLFLKIENDVLGVLKDVFKTVDANSVFYDSYLLGGISGWSGRH